MIGTRGHDMEAGRCSAASLADKLSFAGMEAVQLVAYKSIPGVEDKPGSLTHGLAWSIGREFEKRGIHIALLGSYFNMLEQDQGILNRDIRRFKEYLRFARDFGCPVVGTETGSYNADMSYHPDNHGEKALETVIGIFRDLVEEAEKFGSIVGLEGLCNYTVSTPARIRQVIDAVGSSNLQIIFDPVNLVHPGNYRQVNDIIDECFELFGDRILVIHAKDFILKEGRISTVPLGQGLLDFPYLLKKAAQQKPVTDIIIEDLRGEELKTSHEFLRTVEAEVVGARYGK